MALKDTFKHLRDLINNISHDLQKAENGNKAASQRVRTGTVKLEKVAKLYRKESIKNEKATKGQKKSAKKASAPKKASKPAKAAVKAKGKAKAHRAHPRALVIKRSSAKILSKKTANR